MRLLAIQSWSEHYRSSDSLRSQVEVQQSIVVRIATIAHGHHDAVVAELAFCTTTCTNWSLATTGLDITKG